MSKRRMTKREKGILVEKISDVLKAKEHIVFAYIFGSFVLDDQFKDIDIGVFISRGESTPPLHIELNLEDEVADAIHIWNWRSFSG